MKKKKLRITTVIFCCGIEVNPFDQKTIDNCKERKCEMRRRKVTKETQQTLISSQESGEIDGVGKGKGGRFVACYLLTSLSPRFKGHTYIGFTVNPRRRIRQHNGEIGSGAWRTKKKRPWEMVLCIYGFPTNVAALQFEWAWQHPVESVAVRSAALESCYKLLLHKVQKPYIWLSNFASANANTELYMDELPCYNGSNTGVTDDLSSDDDCDLNDVLHESTQESIEAARKASDSPSILGGFEETFLRHISEKDDTSHEFTGCSKENWIGIKNLQHSREEDQRQSSPPNRVESSFVTSFCNIVSYSYVEDEQILPVSVEELDKKQSTTTFVACKDQLTIKKKVEVIAIFTPRLAI
ncbi:uncharacterized protein [Primulina huaijiensis]|uniref:uncharacterized protein n=1 Tax=Primulina huaijiensis TaxID=1492673 RepID=UPI003CC7447E